MFRSSEQPQAVTPSTLIDLDQYDNDDNFSDFDDEEDFYGGLTTSLRDIKKSTTKYLNLTNSYVRTWSYPEAFRESYQNWYLDNFNGLKLDLTHHRRDGILRSFQLPLSEFKTTYTEKKRVISITVQHPVTSNLLGFIRFQFDKDGYCVGGLKMANFKATLPYDALGTGVTSKAHDSGQTGQHGEGMKLSALVFRRKNLNFRIESGGFKWNFIYKKGELACRLSRMPEKTLSKLKLKAQGQPRTEIAHPWEGKKASSLAVLEEVSNISTSRRMRRHRCTRPYS